MDEQFFSKIDIALVQLRTAIQLYNKGNYISSLTLAGAAEEILGEIAKFEIGKNALTEEQIFTNQFTELFEKPKPCFKKIVSARNKAKNEIKHNNFGYDYLVYYDFEYEAENFILAALRNYRLITGNLPKDRIIINFWNWISM